MIRVLTACLKFIQFDIMTLYKLYSVIMLYNITAIKLDWNNNYDIISKNRHSIVTTVT